MLLLVPNNLREAAAALGSLNDVIMMICYRAAKSRIFNWRAIAKLPEFQEKLHRYYLPLCLINFYLEYE